MILHKQNRQNQKEMERKQKNKMLNNVFQPDSQRDKSSILMIKKTKIVYLVKMMT